MGLQRDSKPWLPRSGAMLDQLSCEATHWEWSQFVEYSLNMKIWSQQKRKNLTKLFPIWLRKSSWINFLKDPYQFHKKRGTITLIPKVDVNLASLKNWHPISLRNVDFHLLLKVLAKRMKQLLSNFIYTTLKRYNGIFGHESTSRTFYVIDFEEAIDTLKCSLIF